MFDIPFEGTRTQRGYIRIGGYSGGYEQDHLSIKPGSLLLDLDDGARR